MRRAGFNQSVPSETAPKTGRPRSEKRQPRWADLRKGKPMKQKLLQAVAMLSHGALRACAGHNGQQSQRRGNRGSIQSVGKTNFAHQQSMKTKIIPRSILGVLITACMLTVASASDTELIINGGLESGSSSWTLSGGVSASTYAGLAHSGTYYLWFGGAVNENDAGYQTITIPANATAATLSFYYNINSAEGTSAAYDTFSATIRNTSGTVLATVGNWSNINKDGGAGNPYYHQQTFNLLSYAGQTIRIYFSSVNDSSLVTNFRVDDVSVQVTVPTGSAPTVSTSPASLITTTTARMNGTVNPNGADTTVYFQIGRCERSSNRASGLRADSFNIASQFNYYHYGADERNCQPKRSGHDGVFSMGAYHRLRKQHWVRRFRDWDDDPKRLFGFHWAYSQYDLSLPTCRLQQLRNKIWR